MDKTVSVLLVVSAYLTAVNCLPGSPLSTENVENVTVLWSEDLPSGPFTDGQVSILLDAIKALTAEEKQKLAAMEGLKRLRRSTGDNSQWCCNKNDPGQVGERIEVIRARVVTKTIPQGGFVRCGLFGWRRCYSHFGSRVVTVTQYYKDYEYPLIPAPQWTNGCPEPNIVCCNGYVYYPSLGNCLTFQQLEDILRVIGENQESLDLLNAFMLG
ncbi:uncharacterized protein [Watersipora subatra]|uniref:uncharacterized protein n=1 Tax=Watersipora subatra TaxID=2589382 RepID=UPI00355C7357